MAQDAATTGTTAVAPEADAALLSDLRHARTELAAVRCQLDARDQSLRALLQRLTTLEADHWGATEQQLVALRTELRAAHDALRKARHDESALRAELDALRATKTFRTVEPARRLYGRARTVFHRERLRA